MAIKESIKNNKKVFIIRAQYRSKAFPHIRVQKQLTLDRKITSKALKKKEQDLYFLCREEVKRKESSDITLQEVMDRWYEARKLHKICTRETNIDYYKMVENWFGHCLKKPCNEIKASHVKSVLNYQLELGHSRAFRKKFKSVINSIFTWAIEEGYLNRVDKSPAQGIRLERVEEKKPEILTLAQTREFLSKAKVLNHPWYSVWAFAVLTGCRNGELYALEKSDIDLENDRIIISKSYNNRRREVKCTKAGEYRTVPINEDLRHLIIELFNKYPNSKYVLPRLPRWERGGQAQILRDFLNGIGLPSVKFHTLRACFATLLIQQGVAPAVIMKVSGWKDLKTMERYIRLAGVDERGVTDGLRVLPDDELKNVISLHSV